MREIKSFKTQILTLNSTRFSKLTKKYWTCTIESTLHTSSFASARCSIEIARIGC